jgi:hypothetical protein
MVGSVIEAVLDVLGALACAVLLFTLGRRRGLISGIAFSVLLLGSLFSAFLPVLVPWVTGPTGLGPFVTTVATVLLFVIDAVGWGLLILAIVRLRAEAPAGPGHAPPPPGPPYGQLPGGQPGQPYGQPGQPGGPVHGKRGSPAPRRGKTRPGLDGVSGSPGRAVGAPARCIRVPVPPVGGRRHILASRVWGLSPVWSAGSAYWC